MQTFPCTACGAPNEPEAGRIQIACAYCNATLTIPESLRTKPIPRVDSTASKAKPVSGPDMDAPDLLRKAQPLAIRAWSLFAAWTWIRWLLPTCLTIFVIGIILCLLAGVLPFVINLIR